MGESVEKVFRGPNPGFPILLGPMRSSVIDSNEDPIQLGVRVIAYSGRELIAAMRGLPTFFNNFFNFAYGMAEAVHSGGKPSRVRISCNSWANFMLIVMLVLI